VRVMRCVTLIAAIPVSVAVAQNASPVPNWGTSVSFKTIDQAGFQLVSGNPFFNGTSERSCSSSQCVFTASLDLPTGAQIIGYSAEGCDSDTTGSIKFSVHQKEFVTGNDTLIGPLGDSGGPASPGCMGFAVGMSPYTVRNQAFSLYAYVSTDFSIIPTFITFRSFRVFYQLQVSPAPASATFSDVPTSHLFFQYIEALAASGITAGCTAPPNPNYCPDAPLTRGQMAVFLSRALGLHFPN